MGEILFLCLQNCIIFSKLHNFLISERLLMYLQQWRRRWEIKCITLYFYGRAPFLLPLGRAVRENRSRNPYFSFLKIQKSIFLISVSCVVWVQLSILFRIAIDQVKILTSGSTRNSREKTDQEKAAQKVYSLLSIRTNQRDKKAGDWKKMNYRWPALVIIDNP